MHGIDLGDSYARIAWPGPDGVPVVTGATDVPATVDATGPDGPRLARTPGARSARDRLFAGAAGRAPGPPYATDPAGGPDPVRPGGPDPLRAAAPTALVLAALARRSRECGGGAPQEVALALPAAGGGGAEQALRRAAEQAGLRVGQVLPESVAAALHYGAVREGVSLSVLVYDQGATSSDLTLLAVDGDRTVRVLETATRRLGGDDWDAAVARELLRRLGSPGAPVGPLLPLAERLRLALGEAPEAWQRVRWEGGEHEVSLDRETLGRLVEPLREAGADAVGALLDSVRERGGDVPGTLLLAGGLSAAPGTDGWFEERCGLTVRSRAPGAAVAGGLALTGGFGLLRVLTGGPAARPRPGGGERGPRGWDGGPAGWPAPPSGHEPEDPLPGEGHPGKPRAGTGWPDMPWSEAPRPESQRSESPHPLAPRPQAPHPEAAAPEAPRSEPPWPGPPQPEQPWPGAAAAPPHEEPWQSPAEPPGHLGAPGPAGPGEPASPPGPSPRTTPRPPTAPDPATTAGAAPPPTASTPTPASTSTSTSTGRTLHPGPVHQLRATRRDDHLLIVWSWPPDSRQARVRWTLDAPDPTGLPQGGDVRCGRRSYQHDGGLDLRVGRGALTVTVEALTPTRPSRSPNPRHCSCPPGRRWSATRPSSGADCAAGRPG